MKPRRSIKHSRRRVQRHGWALLMRIAPAIVLAIGMLLFAASIPRAAAQFPQTGNYQNSGGFQNSGNFNGQYRPNQNFAPPNNSGAFGGPGAAAGPDARVAAFQNTAAGGTNAGGIPAVPMDSTDDGATVDAESGDGWQMPAMLQKLASGGWLMVPLGLCSLIVVALSLERLVALRRSRVIPRPFVRRFTECVEDGQLSYDEATSICEEFDCPVAEVFRAAVRRWGRPMMEIEQAVMDAGDRVNDSLRRFVRVFHAISNVAPLLGLLGTVLGMIEAFEMMGDSQSLGRPEMLASGISMALVTTAAGLSVAIPAYLAYMYFSAKSDRYLGEIDKLCTRVVDSISAEALESDTKSRPRKRAA